MKKYLVILFCLLGLGVSQSANALTFNLTSNHCDPALPCGAPGTIFGQVIVTQNGTSVDITVDLFGPYVYAKTGSVDFLAFKFNATDVTLADITILQNPFAPQTLVAQTGTFNGDGTGAFSFGLNCTTCGNGISTVNGDIVFRVANATIADLTAPNANGNVFVADIGCAAGPTCTAGATGPIDATTAVPDGGATVTLLGSALLGLAMLRRRFGKS